MQKQRGRSPHHYSAQCSLKIQNAKNYKKKTKKLNTKTKMQITQPLRCSLHAQLAALRLKESISGWVCVSYKQNQNKKITARLEAELFVFVFVLFTFILAVLYFLFAFYDFGLLQMSRPAWAVHRLVVHSVGFHSTSFVIPMLLLVSRFRSL